MRNFDLDWDIIGTDIDCKRILNTVIGALYSKIKRAYSDLPKGFYTCLYEYMLDQSPEKFKKLVEDVKQHTDTLYIDGCPNGIQANILKKYFPGITFKLMGPTAESFEELDRKDLLNGFSVYNKANEIEFIKVINGIYNDLSESGFDITRAKLEVGIIFNDVGKKLVYELNEAKSEVSIYIISNMRKDQVSIVPNDKNEIYKETLSICQRL